jgi:hypothetical protein
VSLLDGVRPLLSQPGPLNIIEGGEPMRHAQKARLLIQDAVSFFCKSEIKTMVGIFSRGTVKLAD